MNDLLNQIASESGEGFGSDLDYREKRTPFQRLPKYKINNRNPKDPSAPFTAGISMITTRSMGETVEKSVELTQTVKAVVLFSSMARKLGSGSGKQFAVKCQSHDGLRPSLRIDQPLCRGTTTVDVAKTFAGWKGYDQAKVDAKVAEVTNSEGKLVVCGLKSATGTIALCPYAQYDKIGSRSGPCKPERYVRFYDVERKREFEMVLTGKSDLFNQKFISPFHEFMKYLRNSGPRDANGKPKGLPSFAFVVTLTASQDGAFYFLNVSDWKPIEQAENRAAMHEKALAAKEAYEKDTHRLSKESYEKSNPRKTPEGQATANNIPAPVGVAVVSAPNEQPLLNTPSAPPVASGAAALDDGDEDSSDITGSVTPVSFEDDDINF